MTCSGEVALAQKRQGIIAACEWLRDIIAGDDPGAGDRIFAKFHGAKENIWSEACVNYELRAELDAALRQCFVIIRARSRKR